MWGHSEDTLYKLDPRSRAVTVVGTLEGCVLTDLALDADGNMWGTSATALFKVDKTTAKCTPIATGTYPNSLSFVPKGTVDPAVEALVGFEGATYVRIDTTSGEKTAIGSLEAPYESSGDIVSVKGGLTYLTVKRGPSDQCAVKDCLVEVDPKTGRFIKNFGTLPLADVFGLSFWGGTLYGFTNGGTLIAITASNTGVKTDFVPIPDAPGGLRFSGAGSSTSAPLVVK